MYPIDATTLPVSDLIMHWQRTANGHPPESELLTSLLNAFWAGILEVMTPGTDEVVARQLLIDALHQSASEQPCDIVFFERDEDLGPVLEQHPDGSAGVDTSTRVRLNTDPAQRTIAELEKAYSVLSATVSEHYPQPFLTAFRIYTIDRNEFAQLCDAKGWLRPAFWFDEQPPRPHARSLASARTQARRWLRDQTRCEKNKPKSEYCREAQRLFSGLSERGFNEIWAEVVPEKWKLSIPIKRSERAE